MPRPESEGQAHLFLGIFMSVQVFSGISNADLHLLRMNEPPLIPTVFNVEKQIATIPHMKVNSLKFWCVFFFSTTLQSCMIVAS